MPTRPASARSWIPPPRRGSTWSRRCDSDAEADSGIDPTADLDGDGYSPADGDCDDGDDMIHPGATETCDGVDQDCDGEIDEEPADGTTWYADADGDGYGDAGQTITACVAPEGHVDDDSDCDDGEASVNPGANEVCADGVDDDCDGTESACVPPSGSLSAANATYAGAAVDDYAGVAVAGAGDVDGDGFDDLLVGAPQNDDGGSLAGAAYLVLGSASPASASLSTAVETRGEATRAPRISSSPRASEPTRRSPRAEGLASMDTCCAAMRAAMRPGGAIVQAPPKGNGANLVIWYDLRVRR